MSYSVRALMQDDIAVYRDIRLEGLRTEPTSFGGSLAEEQAIDDAGWQRRLSTNFNFGVFDDAGLTGISSYYTETGEKTRHRGHLFGVYLRPQARGTGAAALLMEALLVSARQQNLSHLYLVVTESNRRAVRFYERIGFSVYGTDPGGLFVDGVMQQDSLMMLRL